MKYEQVMLERFKKDKEIMDQELSITASKFLNNDRELRLVIQIQNEL